jgi:hypothetical protein
MKTTDVKVSLMGWFLLVLAILSGSVAKAAWPTVDAGLVTGIFFAAGLVVIFVILWWNRRAEQSKGGGCGIGDTGDGAGDGSGGDSGGGE